jgi:hypothetical protein
MGMMKNTSIGSSSKKSNSVQATAAASIAIAGKSSRACDGCGVQRAQWYCAADEAYLCDGCDTGVHSANSVAWRHERVRLAPNGAPLKMPKRSSSAASSHHLSKPYKTKGVAKEAAAATDHRQAQATPLLPPPPPPLPTATVVLPSRKRFRSIRPHPQRLRSATTDRRAPRSKKVCKSSSKASGEEREQKVKVEFVDPCEISCDEVVDDYDDDGGGEAPLEVPAFITVIQDSHETSSQISLQQGYNVTGSRFLHEVVGHSASDSDSSFLSGFFKGKAALAQGGGNLRVGGDAEGEDRFLVPDSFEDCCCLDSGVDGTTVSLIGGGGNSESSAVFIGGDIPGLVIDDFHGFDYGLNFDLAIRVEEHFDLRVGGGAAAAAASEDHGCFTSTTCSDGSGSSFSSGVDQQQSGDLENCIPPTPSPFARFFASSRVKTEEEEDVTKQTLQGPAEKLKKKAKEILKCSLEGLSEEDLRHVPSLRLDYEEVLNAWSDRGALWTDDDNLSGSQTVPGSEDSFNSGTPGSCTDICLVPDTMRDEGNLDGGGRGTDDASLSNEGREARVLRYKEKRRTRLFSKKIRYEVRKLNAERRPRMKVS